MGGSGATLGLCIAMIMSKSEHLKYVGKLSIVPGFFNINEPIMFGAPIVIDPIFVIPF
ncbi:PTS transporter subunit EIIC, partial [Brachyspira hyodysenteriae]|nr:PTS transporter subunit EIIC [Brachyspira hyodysenteriae]